MGTVKTNAPQAWCADRQLMAEYGDMRAKAAAAQKAGASQADVDAYKKSVDTFKADADAKGYGSTVTAGSATLDAVLDDAEAAAAGGTFNAAQAGQDLAMIYSQFGDANDAVGDTLSANSRSTIAVDFSTADQRAAFTKAYGDGTTPFARQMKAEDPALNGYGLPSTWADEAWGAVGSSTRLFAGNGGQGDLMVVDANTGAASAFATDGTQQSAQNYAYGDSNDDVHGGTGGWKGGGDAAVFVYRGTDGKFTVETQAQIDASTKVAG